MIELNVDAGEGGKNDAELIRLTDAVNIACGGHAGDLETMKQTIKLAKGKKIGAHPGYPDRENFGRSPLALSAEEIASFVASQIEVLTSLTPLNHVKPHGALYNQAQADEAIAGAILEGVSRVLSTTTIYTLPQGILARLAKEAGYKVVGEGFMDRGYQANGQLIPRGEAGAIIIDPEEAVVQAQWLSREGRIGTLCVHGDSPIALSCLQKVSAFIQRSRGVSVDGE